VVCFDRVGSRLQCNDSLVYLIVVEFCVASIVISGHSYFLLLLHLQAWSILSVPPLFCIACILLQALDLIALALLTCTLELYVGGPVVPGKCQEIGHPRRRQPIFIILRRLHTKSSRCTSSNDALHYPRLLDTTC